MVSRNTLVNELVRVTLSVVVRKDEAESMAERLDEAWADGPSQMSYLPGEVPKMLVQVSPVSESDFNGASQSEWDNVGEFFFGESYTP